MVEKSLIRRVVAPARAAPGRPDTIGLNSVCHAGLRSLSRVAGSLTAAIARLAPARILIAGLVLASASFAIVQAEEVTPSARVVRSVVVRANPTTAARALAALRPGQSLPLIGQVPGWYRVDLGEGRTGYVSKAWTRETPEGPRLVAEGLRQSGAGDVYRIHVVDVGTGLAVFLRGPDFTLVYDAGSNDDKALSGQDRFLAYLRLTNPDLKVIDHLILSHAHQDHVLMIPDVMRAYQIRNVWDSGRMFETCAYRSFLEAVADEPGVLYHEVEGAPGDRRVQLPNGCSRPSSTITLHRGEAITEAPVPLGARASITFLHRDTAPHADPNENSLVARLDLGPVRILLPGDAEGGERRDPSTAPDPGSVEAKLLACCRELLRADVEIVGHHGSKTSSRTAFIDAIGAKIFVISSGPLTYSGTRLPDAEIVEELEARGQLWRTDVEDQACSSNPAKVGPDADGRAGGCDNILLTITGREIFVADLHLSD